MTGHSHQRARELDGRLLERGRSAASVAVAAVPYGDHEDEEDSVVEIIDDPVVTGSGSPFTLAADQSRGL